MCMSRANSHMLRQLHRPFRERMQSVAEFALKQDREAILIKGDMRFFWYGFMLASFPGSPGTQICIAERAWYLFCISMM